VDTRNVEAGVYKEISALDWYLARADQECERLISHRIVWWEHRV
jgi:hypothetical protein